MMVVGPNISIAALFSGKRDKMQDLVSMLMLFLQQV